MILLSPELKTDILMIRFSYVLYHTQYPFNMGTGSQRTALPHISASVMAYLVSFIQCKSSNLRKYNITFDLATE
jgi:hypothetical protein